MLPIVARQNSYTFGGTRPAEFRSWRKKVGLSQEQLAELFDLSRRTIGYYEDGTLLVPRGVVLAMKGYEAESHEAA